MTRLSLSATAVLVPVVGSELALARAKLQTAIPRVLVVWVGAYAAAATWLVHRHDAGLAALTIFWAGAFLVWFGVRSHIESSILLRMLFLLRQRPMTDRGLLDQYIARCGESARVSELRRGGLVDQEEQRLRVTRKGKAILLVVTKLR